MKRLRRVMLLLLIAVAAVVLVGCPDASLLGALGGGAIAVYSQDFGRDVIQGELLDYTDVWGQVTGGTGAGWFDFEIWNDGSDTLTLDLGLGEGLYVLGGNGYIWREPSPITFSEITPGSNEIFQIWLDDLAPDGFYTAAVTIHSDDPLVPVFTFYVTYEKAP